MRKLRSSRNLNWSTTQLSIASICLATVFYIFINLFKAKGVDEPLSPSDPTQFVPTTSAPSPDWGLGEYADLLSIAAIVVGLVAPFLGKLCWKVLNWFRPNPGAKLLDDSHRENLPKAFKIERGNITLATEPEHNPQAAPAKSARSIDLGDAALVIPKSAEDELRRFIGQPKTKARDYNLPDESTGRDILVVTGEPGAGKSILLQEIHATLSLGVESGHHSFIPVFIFARELTMESLNELVKNGKGSMKALLMDYYQARYKADHNADDDLKFLFNLIKYDWDKTDLLIIIDGLDEIAQRSAYEDIQRCLSNFILQDLKSDSQRVHRYILSCRIDEDLELFPSAGNLYLRGLTDAERDRFCHALIGGRNLDQRVRESLEEALQSHRLTPTHVFRRNPYFLALLIERLREKPEEVETQTTDFDFLMKKHLRRESLRAYTPVTGDSQPTVEKRQVLFSELEGVSRACLQYFAFQSASSAKSGALYDETPIDSRLILGFADVINSGSAKADDEGLWGTLRSFLNACLADERGSLLTPNTVHASGFTQHLHENDIYLFDRLALALKHDCKLYIGILEEALGAIRFRGGLESQNWYKRLVEQFLITVEPLAVDPRQSFIILLLLRSIAAAHVLRILNVNISNDAITIRFRHRRLAEYYSACYIRDRWSDLEASIEFSPWLGPVLNLTCAIEGPKCRALHWLVNRISCSPSDSFYEWRYSVEAAVEASFFAQPGVEYEKAIAALLSKIISVLCHYIRLDAVTQISLLRAIEQLGSLKEVLKSKSIIDDQTASDFYEYENRVPAEWIAQVLPARVAFDTLSHRPPSVKNKTKTLWKLIKQPGTIFFSRFRIPRADRLLMRSTVLLSTAFSELCQLGLLIVAITGSLYLLMKVLKMDLEIAWDAVRMISLVIIISWSILKVFTWQRSPTKAASQAAALWRVPSLFLDKPSDRDNEDPLLPNWYLKLLKVAGSLLLITGLTILLTPVLSGIIDKGINIVSKWADEPKTEMSAGSSDKEKIEAKVITCDDINKRWEEIYDRFESIKTETMPPEDIVMLQKEIRREIESLRKANAAIRCGRETDDGWTLAEDRLLDWLVLENSNLVPHFYKYEPLPLTAEEFDKLENLMAAPMIDEPEPGLAGVFATVYRNAKVNKTVSQLKEARLRIVKARREGVGLPKDISFSVLNSASDDEVESSVGDRLFRLKLWKRILYPYSVKQKKVEPASDGSSETDPDVKQTRIQGNPIRASIILTKKISTLVEKYEPIQLNLNARFKRILLYSAVGLVSFGMMILILRLYWKRHLDNKQLAEINEIERIERLCDLLIEDAYSERVRLSIIRRLDTIGVRNEADLREIEDIVGELSQRDSDTERNLGVKVAALVKVLSNRLRHRITTDTSLKAGVESQVNVSRPDPVDIK